MQSICLLRSLLITLEDADVTLRSDHLPLKKFLAKNTLNSKSQLTGPLRLSLLGSLLNISKELKTL